jgi:hypothetical protein
LYVYNTNRRGIISQRDLFEASLASVMGYDYADTSDYLKSVAIGEAMVAVLC